MPDTARPRKKIVATSDAKRELINARRRLRRAEIRCEKMRTASAAANDAMYKANDILLGLLSELKLNMKAAGQTKPSGIIVEVSDDWLETQMSMAKSRRSAKKLTEFLSSTIIFDAMENA